jgi:hypothetical protein
MKADELIALASAHGVDLLQAAAESAETRRHPQRRIPAHPNNPRSRRTTIAPLSARGADSGTIERPAWTLAEVGQAAQGVPRLHFWAACYAFAGDDSVYWKLWEALMGEAWQMKHAHRWPLKVEGANGRSRFYISELCQLVLDEDAHPHLFRTAVDKAGDPVLYPAYLEISKEVWSRQVFEPFDLLRCRFLSWVDRAQSVMRPRLVAQDDDAA